MYSKLLKLSIFKGNNYPSTNLKMSHCQVSLVHELFLHFKEIKAALNIINILNYLLTYLMFIINILKSLLKYLMCIILWVWT